MAPPSRYPDLTEIFARKAKGRRARARLSFAEKLDILDKLKEAKASIALKGRAQPTRPPVRDGGDP